MSRRITTVRGAKRKADKIFSKLIRRMDADSNESMIACITCGHLFYWQDLDCGHFESRRHNGTRYDKRNCAPQCKICNRFEEGRKYEFGKYLIEKYGKSILHELRQLSHSKRRFTVDELLEMCEDFKKELEVLK